MKCGPRFAFVVRNCSHDGKRSKKPTRASRSLQEFFQPKLDKMREMIPAQVRFSVLVSTFNKTQQ